MLIFAHAQYLNISVGQREKVIKNSPNSTTRIYELEAKGDGVVTYQNIDEILEIEIP